jgi:predicted dinucleotide-binding enzyme
MGTSIGHANVIGPELTSPPSISMVTKRCVLAILAPTGREFQSVDIGIVGAGMIGGTLGGLWLRAGHRVRFGTRDPETLRHLVEQAPTLASASTPAGAAAFGDIVLLAVPLLAIPDLGRSVGPLVVGKPVLDACNAYPGRDGSLATQASSYPGGSSAWVASHLSGAHVVKAFNTVYFQTLQSEAHRAGDRLGIPLAGDDAETLVKAEALVRDAGFTPVRIGGLGDGQGIEPGTPAYNTGMSATELARLFGVAHQ